MLQEQRVTLALKEDPVSLFKKCLNCMIEIHEGVNMHETGSRELTVNTPASHDLESVIRHWDDINGHPTDPNMQLMALKHAQLQGWFHGAQLDSIYKENVREWIAWGFNNTSIS